MSTTDSPEYETILQIVRDWPATRRFTLVQDVLKTLAPAESAPPEHRPTLATARGLLAGSRPAPTDTEVAAWLDERRQQRYGS